MPEIGPTLREARMRARLDITEIEAQTKIRAKYLRALENEEWDLLPGPAYVKTFLRTYAEALDLDAKLLVEEYKLRHERLSEIEMQPISPRSTAQTLRRRGGPPAGPPRALVVGVVVVMLLGALWVLGQSGDDEGASQASNAVTVTDDVRGADEPQRESGERESSSSSSSSEQESERERRPRRVRLQLVATGPGPVYVCLVGDNEVLVRGETLQPGDRTETFRARRYVMNLGNGMVAMNINGRRRPVEASSDNIVLELTQEDGRQPYDNAPTCGV